MIRNSRVFARCRTPRLLRSAVLLIVLTVSAATLGAIPVAQAKVTAPVTVTATVSSISGWQQTSFELSKNKSYTVSYLSGTWTVDKRNFPQVGPGGYDNSTDQTIYQGCKYYPQRNYGVLLGKVGGSGADFPIGDGGMFTAASSGPLYLRINDDDACLGDNAGSVKMYISTIGNVPNYSYAGYTAIAGGTGAFRLAEATWVVPSIPLLYCLAHPGAFPRAAAWVGLWGEHPTSKTAWLPQVGTVSTCNNGSPGPHYLGFWEMFTNDTSGGAQNYGRGVQVISSMTVNAGDTMNGAVEYEGTLGADLVYKFQLIDVTRTSPQSPDEFSITVTTNKGVKLRDIMAQGGAVVEPECNDGLAKFATVPFSNVQLDWLNVSPTGVSLLKWIMIGSDGTTLAQPGPVSGFNTSPSYTVTYKASGPTAC
jgi:hypothetical protein